MASSRRPSPRTWASDRSAPSSSRSARRRSSPRSWSSAGARLVPWLLTFVARQGSRELFTLAVLAIALGIAFVSSVVFGVSLALGAFLAGAVVGESDMSHQAAADALPLRDAFAVLFFVSVGMLVDPSYLVVEPARRSWACSCSSSSAKADRSRSRIVTVARLSRAGRPDGRGRPGPDRRVLVHPRHGRAAAPASCPHDGFQLIVAGALLSITLNPFLFDAIAPLEERLRGNGAARPPPRMARRVTWRPCSPDRRGRASGTRHPVRLRAGRADDRPAPSTGAASPTSSSRLQRHEVERLRARGIPAIYGDASNPEILERAHVEISAPDHRRELGRAGDVPDRRAGRRRQPRDRRRRPDARATCEAA